MPGDREPQDSPSETGSASICVHGITALWALKLSSLAVDVKPLICCNCINSKNVMD